MPKTIIAVSRLITKKTHRRKRFHRYLQNESEFSCLGKPINTKVNG